MRRNRAGRLQPVAQWRRLLGTAHHRGYTTILAVFGATVGLGIVGTGVAFGYFVTTDPSNPAQAVANSLPVRKYLPRTTSCSATRQQVVRQSR